MSPPTLPTERPFGQAAQTPLAGRDAGQLTNRLTRTGTGASTNGYVTGYLFDAAGNLTNVVCASGTASVTLGYDALNRLTNMVDGIGTTKCSCAMLGNGLSTMTEDGPWASDEVTVTNRGGLRV
jgi:YD repeat-containing protein